MEITKTELERFVFLTSHACYDIDCKIEYKLLGRKILRSLAKMLELKKDEFEIQWNPGGIACSGDHILHTKKFYLALHDNLGMGWFYYRKCHGLKDYGTGVDCPNQIVNWDFFLNYGLTELTNVLRAFQDKIL